MSPENGEIKYSSPRETFEREGVGQHRFDLIVDGKKVGGAEVDYFSKPLPLYQVTNLYIDVEHNGKRYGSQIMEQVESFLREKKKPGVLVDAIAIDDPASGFYARRGWTEVPDSGGLHVYNWPEGTSLDVLVAYSFRYTDMSERSEWHEKM